TSTRLSNGPPPPRRAVWRWSARLGSPLDRRDVPRVVGQFRLAACMARWWDGREGRVNRQ
ncbi:MAG: hypothetical protein OXG64_10170, partial [Chloroflexi bacterium]|nr:hypothetical protein [Chloroflexota bacterium]